MEKIRGGGGGGGKTVSGDGSMVACITIQTLDIHNNSKVRVYLILYWYNKRIFVTKNFP